MAHVLAHAVVEAWRGIVRNRAFGGVVIAILALGAGSAAALVGLNDALFVRPPAHVVDPDRLVRVNRAGNYVFYQELARGSRTLDVATVASHTLTLGHDETARPVRVECVTGTYFDVLGVAPVAGRSFRPEEDTRGAEPAAVITYRLWQRHFNGRPDIVGDTTTISGRPHRIIGVAPPDFRGLGRHRADAWLLLTAAPELCAPPGFDLLDGRSFGLTTIGRLRPGVPLADAEADVRNLLVGRLSGRLLARELEPAASSGVSMRDELLAISLAAGAILMLLIACANVAGLLSTRALHRRREIAVRAQLGASRARLFLQLFIENLMLTAVSIVAAWGVAGAITSVLSAFFPPLARDTWFDPRGLIVLAVFTLGAGLVAGSVPAIQAARAQGGGLWRTGQDVSHRRAYWRRALIAGQVALALLLVASAGLFMHSLFLVKRDLGYDIGSVVIAPLDLQQAGIHAPGEIRIAFDEMLARVRALPGVEAASLTARTPDVTGQGGWILPTEEGAPPISLMLAAHHVSPEYFRTLNTRILEGRTFTPEDRLGDPKVMIVDANLARELWPGEAVVGRCKSIPRSAPCITVIGISEPRRFDSLTRPDGEVFMPLAQHPSVLPQAVVARARSDAENEENVPAVTAAIRSAVPSLAFANVQPLANLVDEGAETWRLGATLFGLFGGLAVVLAAAGLYASLAFAVRQRTPEIGVRLALGANPASVAKLVIGEGARLIAFGWLLGTAAALYTADWIRSLLFGVQPGDPATYAFASLVIVLAGLAGSMLPALRAAKVDPAVALRAD